MPEATDMHALADFLLRCCDKRRLHTVLSADCRRARHRSRASRQSASICGGTVSSPSYFRSTLYIRAVKLQVCSVYTINRDFAMAQLVYKSPSYVTRAANQKFGRRIKIMGITANEELQLWKKIDVRAVSTGKPERKTATIVDVKTMSLVNKSAIELHSESSEKECANESYNEVEIGSRSNSNLAVKKSYQLQLGDLSQGEIGGLISTKLGEAAYYNSSGAPVFFETGPEGVGKTKKEKEDVQVDKDYRVMERLKVPPKTKVTATILTKNVTYELKVVTELRVNTDIYVPIRFKGRVERKLGSLCTATIRSLTAEDLFCNEMGYKNVDGVITFTREGTVTYSGEEVEILTDMEEI